MMKAIVTLVIGEKYVNIFERCCRENWREYAQNFGYDLIVITEALDSSERAKKRSVAWQKLLILSQEWSTKYDRVVWIDADIIVNNDNAYDISSVVPVEKVGAVESYSIPTRDLHKVGLRRQYDNWKKNGIKYIDNETPECYYVNRGFDGYGLDAVVQTGVLVCSPKHHKEIFEKTYYGYEDTHGPEWNYEMPALSYELVKNNLAHWMSPSFNLTVATMMPLFHPEKNNKKRSILAKIWDRIKDKSGINFRQYKCLQNIYSLSIFMHFAGCSNLMNKFTRSIS